MPDCTVEWRVEPLVSWCKDDHPSVGPHPFRRFAQFVAVVPDVLQDIYIENRAEIPFANIIDRAGPDLANRREVAGADAVCDLLRHPPVGFEADPSLLMISRERFCRLADAGADVEDAIAEVRLNDRPPVALPVACMGE